MVQRGEIWPIRSIHTVSDWLLGVYATTSRGGGTQETRCSGGKSSNKEG